MRRQTKSWRAPPHARPTLPFIFSFLLFATGIQFSSPGGAQEDSGKIQIAVLDVVPKGKVDKDLPDVLGLLISARLSQSGAFDVVTQEDVRQMIGFEKMKNTLGCELDASCLAEIGAALGVPYLLTSQVAKVGSIYILSMSLIDIDQAKGISRDTIKASSQDQLITELESRVDRLVAPLRYSRGGQVAFICPERGALVEVDGRALGVTPLAVQDLPAGPHRIVVTKAGFFRFTRDIDLVPGDTLQVEIQLQGVGGEKPTTETPKAVAAPARQSTDKDAPPAEAPTEEESSGSILTSPLFYVGLAALGTGGVAGLGGAAVGTYSYLQLADTNNGKSERELAQSLFWVSIGMVGAGSAVFLLGGGVTATAVFLE